MQRGCRTLWRGFAACLAVAAAFSAAADERRPGPRAERTAADRDSLAATLRDLYRRPPGEWPAPQVDDGVAWREIGLLPAVAHPETNPWNAPKAALGRLLFFDPRLSDSGKMSCASCHEPNLGWADGRAVSQPHGRGPHRNTPSIRNIAFQPALFWDGRAQTVEDQVEMALTNPEEMAGNPRRAIALVEGAARYRELFAAAFADRPVDFAGIVAAIACFERTVVGGRSRFDAFVEGDAAALTDDELLGLDLYRGAGRCMNCHHGPTFSDGRFHNLGLSFHGRSNEDLGRFAITLDPADKGRFRTPSLRDVTRTTPLMHTGMFELRGVLTMYNAGMVTLKRQPYERDDPNFPVKSPHLRPLGLNRQDLADLAAFLATLEEPRQAIRAPDLPPQDDPAASR